jgi:hypothetical protein
LHDLFLKLRDDQLYLPLLLQELGDIFVFVGDGLPSLLQPLPDDLALTFDIGCNAAVYCYLGRVRG